MQWPSKSIPHGGILHPAKTSYSEDTHKLLRVLMDEAKMTMQQRKKMDYFLRNGEPLPLPTSKSAVDIRKKIPTVLIRPGTSKRRSKETIVRSGAYEREKFIAKQLVDREKEKIRLQDRMAYGKDIKPKPPAKKIKKNKEPQKETNRFDQLVNEIKEREEWLKKMEELGEAKHHKFVIQQQIQARIREMQGLKLSENN